MSRLPTLHEGKWAPKKNFVVKQTAASFKTRFKEWHTKNIEEYLTDSDSSSFIYFVDISVRKVKKEEVVHRVTVTGFSTDINCVLNYLVGSEKAEVQFDSEEKVATSSISGGFKIYKSFKAAHTDNSSGSVESGYSSHSLDANDLSKSNLVLPIIPPQYYAQIPTPKPKLIRAKGTLFVGGIELDKSNCYGWPINHVLTTSSAKGGMNLPEEEDNVNGTDFENVIFELLIYDGDKNARITNAYEGLTGIKEIKNRKSMVYWIFRHLIEDLNIDN